jgi:hypothetical protein
VRWPDTLHRSERGNVIALGRQQPSKRAVAG